MLICIAWIEIHLSPREIFILLVTPGHPINDITSEMLELGNTISWHLEPSQLRHLTINQLLARYDLYICTYIYMYNKIISYSIAVKAIMFSHGRQSAMKYARAKPNKDIWLSQGNRAARRIGQMLKARNCKVDSARHKKQRKGKRRKWVSAWRHRAKRRWCEMPICYRLSRHVQLSDNVNWPWEATAKR